MLGISVIKNPENHDHNDFRFEIDGEPSGFGYIGKKDGQIGLTRCPICGLKNYAFSVLSGKCAWCGFNIHDQGGIEEINKPSQKEVKG